MSDESLPRKVARAERASWIRPGTLLTLYAGRLRRQWLQELLAGAGIATGVMLVFGVLAANTSIKSSARDVAHGIAGRAQLQLRAIGADGFDAHVVRRVRTAPGVQAAAAVLQTHATLRYDDRQVGIDLVGLDDAYTRLGGVTSRPAMFGLFRLPGIYLSASAGNALGIRVGEAPSRPVTVAVRGRARQIPVIGVLGRSEIGALANTSISSTSLFRAQQLSGLPGRATRILVVARPGQEGRARESLERIARAEGLQTSTIDDELRALAVATAPNDQSTTLFAAIAAIVGLMMFPPSQVHEGNYATANARLRIGGWVTISDRIAQEQGGISPGGTITLPTPTGRHTYRVAAITTNLGWGPGAVAMSAADYARDWASDAPTAIEVDVRPGVSPAHVAGEIRGALGPSTGLEVKTTPQAVADAAGIVRDGLARLRQISTLLLIAAAAAIAVAMIATIRDRRPQLAAYAIEGWSRAALWRALMAETAMILLAGCVAGVAAGTYGHYLGGRWLQQTTSFPAPWSWSPGAVLPICALLAGVALLVTAVPGWFAAQPGGRLAIERR